MGNVKQNKPDFAFDPSDSYDTIETIGNIIKVY